MYRVKRSQVLFLICLACLLFLSGCGSAEKAVKEDAAANVAQKSISASHQEQAAKTEEKAGFSADLKPAENPKESVERKIIKHANLTQKVTDWNSSINALQNLVNQSGGFVQSSTMLGDEKKGREANYVIRVPQQNYLSILDEFKKIGKNESVSQKGDDVTQEFYDNAAHIKNLQLQEEAVQKLLTKADKMEDIIKIQQELFRIRGDIEQLQGKNRYLDNLSSLSTIEISLKESKTFEDSPWDRAKEGFIESLEGLASSSIKLLVLLITALPYLIILGLLGWAGWRFRSRKKKRSEQV